MTSKLSQKFILAFLGLTICVLGITLSLANWSFKQGFSSYIQALENRRLSHIKLVLIEHYQANGTSWRFMSNIAFHNILGGRVKGDRPPPPKDDKHKRPPPPHHIKRPPPTALFDSSNKFIAGSELPDDELLLIKHPIFYKANKIGELRSYPKLHLETQQAREFYRQQAQAALAIAIFSLCIACLAALYLTKKLTAPLDLITKAISALSSGNYDTHIQPNNNDEIGSLMKNVNHLAVKLKQNKLARQRWIADISHELRTPLTILHGEVQAIQEGIKPLNQTQLESFEQEVNRLNLLVEDLHELSISDIGGLRYSMKTVNLVECVNHALQEIQNLSQRKKIEIYQTNPSKVLIDADKNRLQQLFINLLNNAIAYTDSPGMIKINFDTKVDRDNVKIFIEDSPPGVDNASLENLFDPLYRVESSRNRHLAGSGLGLAICKNIVEAHQGTIQAKPSSLGGVCIILTFPLKKT